VIRLLPLLLLCCAWQAVADDKWVYEFELAWGIPSKTDRLLAADCGAVVPVQFVEWYAVDPKPGWQISCGNNQPMFLHFLGRRCWNPLPKLELYCGWTHFSSPADNHEISFDALSVRGRFEFGKARR
jgi:hypothetical protein